MASDLDFERKHPRHPSGSEEGGRFTRVERGVDWATLLSDQIDRDKNPMRYYEVDYRDLMIDGRPARTDLISPYGSARSNLSQSQKNAISAWTHDVTRGDIADFLRSGEFDEPVETQDQVDLHNMVAELDSAVAAGTITSNAELWRALVIPKYQDPRKLFPLDARVTDRSFLATAYNKSSAELIAMLRLDDQEGHKAIYLRLQVPAGTHAAPGAEGVAEFILARNTVTRVIRNDEINVDGDHIITLEVVP